MEDINKVGIVILAAGASKRFRKPKQLLEFRGKTLLRKTIETALQTGCRRICVVLGANYKMLKKHIADLPIEIAKNTKYKEGMMSSLRSGLKKLLRNVKVKKSKESGKNEETKETEENRNLETSREIKRNEEKTEKGGQPEKNETSRESKAIQAVVVMLCDQPFVETELIEKLIKVFWEKNPLIVACEYSGTYGVPVLFSHLLFDEILQFPLKEGAKLLIEKYKDFAQIIPAPEASVDIDTPQDYQKLCKRIL
jgi:molybdenum cofactor cytidylyltransferase